MSGRRQTTKGIWLALGQKIQAPRTLLLDLEGSDGRERGEDDNSFERQSSLFALAVAGGPGWPAQPNQSVAVAFADGSDCFVMREHLWAWQPES